MKIDIKVLNSCYQKGKWFFTLDIWPEIQPYIRAISIKWTIKCPFVIPCSRGFGDHIDKFIEIVKK